MILDFSIKQIKNFMGILFSNIDNAKNKSIYSGIAQAVFTTNVNLFSFAYAFSRKICDKKLYFLSILLYLL